MHSRWLLGGWSAGAGSGRDRLYPSPSRFSAPGSNDVVGTRDRTFALRKSAPPWKGNHHHEPSGSWLGLKFRLKRLLYRDTVGAIRLRLGLLGLQFR